MVVFLIGTVTRRFLAKRTPFLMAESTSGALPRPTPTRLFLSPTTISTEKPMRLPPLVFFDTRLTCITRSSNSLSCASRLYILEFQASASGRIGQNFQPAVILISTAVKNNFNNFFLFSGGGNFFSHVFGVFTPSGG